MFSVCVDACIVFFCMLLSFNKCVCLGRAVCSFAKTLSLSLDRNQRAGAGCLSDHRTMAVKSRGL